MALYLDLMCLLGSSFDTDPQIPWASEMLADRSFPTQDERIDRVHTHCWEYAQAFRSAVGAFPRVGLRVIRMRHLKAPLPGDSAGDEGSGLGRAVHLARGSRPGQSGLTDRAALLCTVCAICDDLAGV